MTLDSTSSILFALFQELFNELLSVKVVIVAQARQIASLQTSIQNLETENKKIKQENEVIKVYLCAKDLNAAICK